MNQREKIDEPLLLETLKDFAKGFTDDIHHEALAEGMAKVFNWDAPDEFYRGLIAGLCISTALYQDGLGRTLPSLSGYVSKVMIERGIVK